MSYIIETAQSYMSTVNLLIDAHPVRLPHICSKNMCQTFCSHDTFSCWVTPAASRIGDLAAEWLQSQSLQHPEQTRQMKLCFWMGSPLTQHMAAAGSSSGARATSL